MACHAKQVISGDTLLESRSSTRSSGKRARLSSDQEVDKTNKGDRRDSCDDVGCPDYSTTNQIPSSRSVPRTTNTSTSSSYALPAVPNRPTHFAREGALNKSTLRAWRPEIPRATSPSPSTSSSFSGVTTSAALSSRASLSSCRSSVRGGSIAYGSSRSFSRPSSSSDGFFPTPPVWDNKSRRDRRPGRNSSYSRRDRRSDRELQRNWDENRRWSRNRGVSARAWSGRDERVRGRGYKRSRSGSRERGRGGGVECTRCLEWCRASRERKAITRTLPMEYWVRTAGCKAAKSRHIDYIDKVAFSREQFIEETVFTCPFTGIQRDILLERNMFPYDVPTDVEHWTLWSRKDLSQTEMEEFVQKWVAENHPHVVDWECDNNEGDRSIDWYHVHVFFRVGCQDKSGTPRDPASMYDGPCGTPPMAATSNSLFVDEEVTVTS